MLVIGNLLAGPRVVADYLLKYSLLEKLDSAWGVWKDDLEVHRNMCWMISNTLSNSNTSSQIVRLPGLVDKVMQCSSSEH